jgi:hypothetical protein
MSVLILAILIGMATTAGVGALLYHDSKQHRRMVRNGGRR